MEYISSDTSVWIDFSAIDRIELPFRLPYTYIMNSDAINDELLSPVHLRGELLRCGLISVELTLEEFDLAEEFGPRYPNLSIYDRIALAIAKVRKIILLTGKLPRIMIGKGCDGDYFGRVYNTSPSNCQHHVNFFFFTDLCTFSNQANLWIRFNTA